MLKSYKVNNSTVRGGWRGLRGELRGSPVRCPLCDVAAGGRAPVPGRGLPADGRPALPAGVTGRDGGHAPVHPPGRADLHRRGVPGRHGVDGPVRRRADDRGVDQVGHS